jgi:hypothetical protein
MEIYNSQGLWYASCQICSNSQSMKWNHSKVNHLSHRKKHMQKLFKKVSDL